MENYETFVWVFIFLIVTIFMARKTNRVQKRLRTALDALRPFAEDGSRLEASIPDETYFDMRKFQNLDVPLFTVADLRLAYEVLKSEIEIKQDD